MNGRTEGVGGRGNNGTKLRAPERKSENDVETANREKLGIAEEDKEERNVSVRKD